MNHPRSLILLFAAQLSVAAGALAQATPFRTITMPGTGPWVPAAIGDYTDNRREHVVAIDAQHHPYLMYSPATHSTVPLMSTTWSVNDVTTLPKRNLDGSDRLLGIGPDGLTYGSYDQNSVFSWYVLCAADWMNGLKVQCSGVTTRALVVGIMANQTQVRAGMVANGTFSGDV